MFKTFWKTCFSLQQLDEFLNNIIAEGYQPWIYREICRQEWRGCYVQRGAIDVYVTAFQIQVVPKQLPASADGCKFHQS